MKNTKIAQVTSLFVAAFLLAAVNIIVVPDTAFAAPKSDLCKGKKAERPTDECDGDDDESGNLQAKFDLTISSSSDISGIVDTYVDSKKEHVSIFTGSGDGFRFDTNTQNVNKLSRWMSAKWVYMSVDGSANREYEIDFRFNQTTGLDLGSLEAVGDSGTVAAAFKYFGGGEVDGFEVSNHGVLAFGELTTSPPMFPDPTSPDNTCLEGTGPIEITRNDDGTWTLRSTGNHLACAFAIDANGDIECTHSTPCSSNGGDGPEAIRFEFEFTLTQQ